MAEEGYYAIAPDLFRGVASKSNNIIALGGGAFLNEKIRSKILKNDYSIWLKWNKETLTSRLTKSKKRPITYSLKKKQILVSHKELNIVKLTANI